MRINGSVFFLLLIITIAFNNCRNNPSGLEGTIAQLEKKWGPPYSPESANQLVKAYQNYVSTYPDRDDQNAVYLRKGAKVAMEAGQYPQAVELLNMAIKDHLKAESSPENVLLLGEIYRNSLKNENVAATIFQSGRKQFPKEPAFEQYLNDQWPPLKQRLEALRSSVMDTIQKQINYTIVNDYILSCGAYAMILPKDTLSPTLLFRAGQLAHQTQTYNKALELLDWMYLEYPDHPLAADALFLNGYILDSELKRFDEAKQRYEAFLKKYPDNEFAETTQFLLDNLGVPAEEIIKRFENQ